MSVDVSPTKSTSLWAVTCVCDWRNGFLDKEVTPEGDIHMLFRNDMSCAEKAFRRIVAEPAFLGLAVVALVETALKGTFGIIALGVHSCLPPGETKAWVRTRILPYTLDMTFICAATISASIFLSLFNLMAIRMQLLPTGDLSCCISPNREYSLL